MVLPKVVGGLMRMTLRPLVPRRQGHCKGTGICSVLSGRMRTSFRAALIAPEIAPPGAGGGGGLQVPCLWHSRNF